MKRFWRDVRLIPVVLLAMVALFALKVSGLVFDGGYTLAERLQNRDTTGLKVTTAESVPQFTKIVVADAAAPNSTAQPAPTKPWAREMFNFNADSRDITGSVGEKKEGKNDEKPGDKTSTKIDGMPVSNEPPEATKVEVGGATYDFQLEAFARAVERGDAIVTGPDDAIANMVVIDAVYRAAGLEPRQPTV